MSTRTDWGWFAKDGTPLAVGDAHHGWQCQTREWEHDGTYTHPITGEVERIEPYVLPCPLQIQDEPIRADVCTRCGNQFRYP